MEPAWTSKHPVDGGSAQQDALRFRPNDAAVIGELSDRLGGENVASVSFLLMLVGGLILMVSATAVPAFMGMMVLGTGMGVANAAIFELVPKYVPEAVGGASGWIGGIGGAGTLVIIPALGMFVDVYGQSGYARGFILFVVLSGVCSLIAYGLGRSRAE